MNGHLDSLKQKALVLNKMGFNMKRILYIFLLFVLFIPSIVIAEECDNDRVFIDSITMVEKSDSVVVNDEPSINGMDINIDNTIAKVGDSIIYNISVKNESDVNYYLKKSDFNVTSDYLEFKYEPEDGSNVIEPGIAKNVKLTITYKNEVPDDLYKAGAYNVDDTVRLNFANSDSINVSNTLKNIGIVTIIFIAFIMIMIVCGLLSIKNRKYNNLMIFIIGSLMFILPAYVSAMCFSQICLKSKLEIKKNYNPCTYDGELVQGAEFVSGQYTYHYKERFDLSYNYSSHSFVSSWKSINDDGWGVTLTDKDSTDPVTSKLCTSINGKPLVSTAFMFRNSKTTSIDTSSFDTSNVNDMQYMFAVIEALTSLDVSTLDTSNVKDMYNMFASLKNITSLDVSAFDTSKVTYFTYMFYNCQKLESLDVTNFDTSSAINIHEMFGCMNVIEEIDLSNFRTPNVTDITNLFSGCSSLKKVDLSSFDTSKVTYFGPLFEGCSSLEEINISNWVINVQPGSLFYGPHSSKKVIMNNVTLNFDNYEKLLGMMELEPTVEIVEAANWHFKEGKTSIASIFKPYYNYGAAIKSLTGLDTWDVSNITGFGEMFSGLTQLESLNLDNWNLKVIPGGLLSGATGLKYLSCKKWVTPATFTHGFFRSMVGESSIESIDVSNWDLSNTTNISGLFGYYGERGTNLKEIKGLDTWDVSNITGFGEMFGGLTQLESLNLDNWNLKVIPDGLLSGATGLKYLSCKKWVTPATFTDGFFRRLVGESSIESIDVSNWDLSNTTNISGLFGYNGERGANLKEIKGLDTWDTSTITNMSNLFIGLSSMTSLNLSSFNTSNVTNMGSMFNTMSAITTLDLSSFDMSSVTSAGGMLYNCNSLTTVYVKDAENANIVQNSGGVPTITNIVVKES